MRSVWSGWILASRTRGLGCRSGQLIAAGRESNHRRGDGVPGTDQAGFAHLASAAGLRCAGRRGPASHRIISSTGWPSPSLDGGRRAHQCAVLRSDGLAARRPGIRLPDAEDPGASSRKGAARRARQVIGTEPLPDGQTLIDTFVQCRGSHPLERLLLHPASRSEANEESLRPTSIVVGSARWLRQPWPEAGSVFSIYPGGIRR